jgi:preprotein translocase subunit YajC
MSLIPSAFAATGAATAQSSQFNFMSFLPMLIIFVLFWFLLIRPQQKKAKEHSKMVSELQKGDEVLTSGGILGKIANVTEQFIQLEVASNVVITVQKSTVTTKLEKGTLAKAS